ncbi:Acb2/Tad1 domain-containing protein [Nocardiopsis alba]|uniref:Acb2/Tad1 domain-containing protein n=1 Tax=Nocardiopsis alba TaxID=53437 RepID=UPI0033B6FA53
MAPSPEPKAPGLVDPQHPGTVTGYTAQPKDRVELVNRIKDTENALGDLLAELRNREDVDSRMLALGRTNLQQGFMWTVRSVFQPESRL